MANTVNMAWQLPARRQLSPRQLRTVIKRLGLNQVTASRFFGVSPRTMRRMVEGATRTPVAIALLASLMLHHGELPVVPPKAKRKRGV